MKRMIFAVLTVLLTCCGTKTTQSGLNPEKFKSNVNGSETELYRLYNDNGMEVCLTNYGARIVSVMVPDREGIMRDVVLGFDNINDYVNTDNNFGAVVGRYANRIDKGRFSIDGIDYQLPINNFGHCLHGGINGWDRKVWEGNQVGHNEVTFTYLSPDGDENFPGNVTAKVKYVLTDDNEIKILYSATTDKPTIVNMSNHSYFNLSGDPSTDILDHILTINADNFTPIDSTFMTFNEIRKVDSTSFDFTKPKAIGRDIDENDVQLRNGLGYDHNFVLNNNRNISILALSAMCPATGITLEIYTDAPGIQFYSGNFLDGTLKGKKDIVYNKRSAFAAETQYYPNSPNSIDWPSPVLRPKDTYTHNAIFKFSVTD